MRKPSPEVRGQVRIRAATKMRPRSRSEVRPACERIVRFSSQLHSVTSPWQTEIIRGGSIYTMGITKLYKSGHVPHPPPKPNFRSTLHRGCNRTESNHTSQPLSNRHATASASLSHLWRQARPCAADSQGRRPKFSRSPPASEHPPRSCQFPWDLQVPRRWPKELPPFQNYTAPECCLPAPFDLWGPGSHDSGLSAPAFPPLPHLVQDTLKGMNSLSLKMFKVRLDRHMAKLLRG